jgi:hypothetical protein
MLDGSESDLPFDVHERENDASDVRLLVVYPLGADNGSEVTGVAEGRHRSVWFKPGIESFEPCSNRV